MFKTIEWTPEGVVMIDQRLLPEREVYVCCRTAEAVADAIKSMVIRGAPAIGVAAAMGIALGVKKSAASDAERIEAEFDAVCRLMAETRPTAVNLFWAIERMRRVFQSGKRRPLDELKRALEEEAVRIYLEDIVVNEMIGEHGQVLIPERARVLTHCNAGALATAGYGTALGVIRSAVRSGKQVEVLADETRPFLQGARLTAWELMKDNIPVKLITDSMAGYFMRRREVDCVIVGADRVAANGDVANKIGTYSLAVLAHENGIPFYVAAPTSTVDLGLKSGDEIPIEQRSPDEVRTIKGFPIAPDGTPAANPAFDVTPARYVSAIITEKGIARAPLQESLARLVQETTK